MTILFAGGGTGGHLYPAIAIAEEILKIDPNSRVAFVGTRKKIEARVVPQKGFQFHTIWISGFSRRFTVNNLLFPVKVIVSLIQSFFVIRSVRPDVVLGPGGYVSGPVLFVASLMGIPTVIHESNSYPGVTTRILASRATKVMITFEVTKRWLSSTASVEVAGNPTREELSAATRIEGSRFFNLDPAKKTILVFGGSLGAASINRVMPSVAEDAVSEGYQIIWQTGESDQAAAATVQQLPGTAIVRYLDRMDCAYAAADLVVCRAGATTLAELTRLGKPAILVPYPHAAANHQELNAQTMVDAGAARIIRDSELTVALLKTVREVLHNDAILAAMSEKSAALGKPNAGNDIAKKLIAMKR